MRAPIVPVRWMTAFIDRPAAGFDRTEAFWLDVTATRLSTRRGPTGAFATLLPADGDAYLRVQRVASGRGGSHLDLHVDDVATATDHAVDLGAEVVTAEPGLSVMRSPAGLPWCLVLHHGESVPPNPRRVTSPGGEGVVFQVDQFCVDVPADRFDAEVAFWAALTGWTTRVPSSHAEFCFVLGPAEMPLRLLLQRRDDSDGDARAHLDLSSSDRDAVVARLVELGATVGRRFDDWTVLADPSGLPFCVTRSRPRLPADA